MRRMDEEILYQHRYVATAGTVRAMARAFVDHLFRVRRTWLFLALVWVLFAGVFLLGMDSSYSLRTRLGWSVALGLVPTVVLVLALAALSYVRTIRSARTRVFDGAVLESGFGTDEFVFRNPVASSRTRYSVVRSIDVRGDHVFVRQHGVPLVAIYPRELFPDEAVEQMRRG